METAKTEVSKENGQQEKVLSDKEALALIHGYAKELGYTIEGTVNLPEKTLIFNDYITNIIASVFKQLQVGWNIKKL